MPARHMRQLAVAVALALAAALAACGDDSPDAGDIPADAVAVVGDQEISQETFDRWAANMAKSQGLTYVPDPPEFEKCTAAILEQPVPKGTPKRKRAEVIAQCQSTWDQLRTSTMSFLIQAESALQAAEDLDLLVTDADIRETLPSYRSSLKASGMSEEDYLYQQRAQILQGEVNTQVQANADVEVSDEEAQDYYDENEEQYQRPETRSAMLLTAQTKAKAEQAKRRLEDGDSWEEVAQDLASPNAPLASPVQFTASQADKAAIAAFEAEKDVFTGPVRTETGWAVLQVTDIAPSGTTPFDQVKSTIVGTLTSQRESEAVTEHQEDVKEATVCKEEYLVPACGNMPEPEPAATAPAEEQ